MPEIRSPLPVVQRLGKRGRQHPARPAEQCRGARCRRQAQAARACPLWPYPSRRGSDQGDPNDRTGRVNDDVSEARIATRNVELGNLDARGQQRCREHAAAGRPIPERKGCSEGHEQNHIEKHAGEAPVAADETANPASRFFAAGGKEGGSKDDQKREAEQHVRGAWHAHRAATTASHIPASGGARS